MTSGELLPHATVALATLGAEIEPAAGASAMHACGRVSLPVEPHPRMVVRELELLQSSQPVRVW